MGLIERAGIPQCDNCGCPLDVSPDYAALRESVTDLNKMIDVIIEAFNGIPPEEERYPFAAKVFALRERVEELEKENDGLHADLGSFLNSPKEYLLRRAVKAEEREAALREALEEEKAMSAGLGKEVNRLAQRLKNSHLPLCEKCSDTGYLQGIGTEGRECDCAEATRNLMLDVGRLEEMGRPDPDAYPKWLERKFGNY